MTGESPNHGISSKGGEAAPIASPRDFVERTGALYVKVGIIALLLSCPLSLTAPRPAAPDASVAAPVDSPAEASSRQQRLPLGTIAYGASIVATLVGSLAMIAAGWAMQGQLTRGPTVALAATGPLALLYLAAAVTAAFGGGWGATLFAAALAAGAIALLLLAARSAVIVRRHPPEKTREQLAAEGMEAYRARRRQRLEDLE
ncbi:MAG: hypothetical protein C4547_04815 [Phycisphaerales bacterium]|nr:MAG: hypothetical protein C4547_04815 [Phycisphaerales bacterium]